MNMMVAVKTMLVAVTMAILALTGITVYFDFIERPFLYYLHIPFPVKTKQVVAGSAVPVEVTRCNRDDRTRAYTIAHTLVSLGGGRNYVLPAAATSIEPGCETITSQFNVVPPNAKPGRYMIRGVAEVQGTLRTSLVEWDTEPFDVVAKE